jgi:hypothetical protein
MIEANVPLGIRFRLFKEAFHTVTDLDALVPITLGGKTASRYNHWSGGKEPRYAKFLRTWGEAGTVKLKNKATGKLEERGTVCMFVGYAEDHTGDVYRMWNAQTGKIYESRDVIWLRRMYYTKSVEEDDDEFIISVPAPEFEEAAAPKDGEGNETNAKKGGQLFADDDAHKNGQSEVHPVLL